MLQTNPSGKWLLLGLDDSFRSALGSGLLAGDFGTWLSGCLSRGLLGGSLHRLLLHNLLDGLDQSLALALQSLDDLLLFDEESADDSLAGSCGTGHLRRSWRRSSNAWTSWDARWAGRG